MYCVLLPPFVLDFLQYVTACLVWGSQKWDTAPDVVSPVPKDHFPGPAGYFLTNSPGHCCPLLSGNTASLCSTCPPLPCVFFPQELLSIQLVPSLSHCTGFFHHRFGTLHVPLLNLVRFPTGQYSTMSMFLWITTLPYTILHAPPIFYHYKMTKLDNFSLFSSLIEILNSIFQAHLGKLPWDSSPQHLWTRFEHQFLNKFKIILLTTFME